MADNIYQLNYTGEKINEAIGKALEVDKKADADDVYTKDTVDSLLDDKQNSLTFDDAPTEDSTNPVTSMGIKSELDKKADADSVYTQAQTDTALGAKADASDVYTKTQTDNIIKSKMSTVYKIKGSNDSKALDYMGRANHPEIGSVYNVSNLFSDGKVGSAFSFESLGVSPTSTTFTSENTLKIVFADTGEAYETYSKLFGTLLDCIYFYADNTWTDYKMQYFSVSPEEATLNITLSESVPNYSTATVAGFSQVFSVTQGDNVVWTDSGWDRLSGTIDLSGYQEKLTFDTSPTSDSTNPVTSGGVKAALDECVKNTDYATSDKGGIVKVHKYASHGLSMPNDNYIKIVAASNEVIDKKTSNYLPIVPANLDYAVKSVTVNTLSDEETAPVSSKTVKAAVNNLSLRTSISGYPINITDALADTDVINCRIYGESGLSGTPSPNAPLEIQTVGDLVTNSASEHYGRYEISLYSSGAVESDITLIYLDEPLRKVGNVADYIDFEAQKVVRCIKERTLDGSENWSYRDSDNMFYMSVPDMASSAYCISTHFLDENRRDLSQVPYLRPIATSLRIYKNNIWTSADELKTFLANQKTSGTPVIMHYILSEPITQNITVSSFSLRNGDVVNISSGTETAPSKIELEYYQDINKVIPEINTTFYSKSETQNILSDYQRKPEIVNQSSGGSVNFIMPGINGNVWNYINAASDITSISIVIPDGEYSFDFIGSVTFKTGNTPPQVSYTNNSKTLVWVGSECSISGSSSVFAPVANKVYDIVFYFNGAAFVGLVNGYTLPAEG